MPRGPRYIPPGSLVEITCRTLESRYFLRPSRELREAIHGVLARAATIWQVGVVAWVYASNHRLCRAAHKQCYGERAVMWSPGIDFHGDGGFWE